MQTVVWVGWPRVELGDDRTDRHRFIRGDGRPGRSGLPLSAVRTAKRVLDLAGAALGLVVAAPILGTAALAIKIEDGGPIIHRRRILGLGGRELDAFKLRTMRIDADGWLARHPELLAEYEKNIKLRDDPRITRAGAQGPERKSSIDELPQLINVLRGEMFAGRATDDSPVPRAGASLAPSDRNG